jgi:N-acylneuraminate cytidylyltransferase
MRPKNLSDDYATTISVMQDAVKRIKTNVDDLESVCCIYPLTPLLEPIHLSQGLKILESDAWNYVFSASKASTPPQRFFSLEKSQSVQMLFPEYEVTRTQDLAQTYHDAGQFYWGRKFAWESGLPIFSSESTIIEIPRELAIDIDTIEDWQYAETLFSLKSRQ